MGLKDWYRATETEAERELRRKLRRKARLEAVLGWIGLAVLIPLSILLFWLYLVATPDWPEGATERAQQNQEAMP
jgi:hypothetical protein